MRWVVGLCALWCGAAWALSPDKAIDDFRITTWGTKEGAPATISALAQTQDGYLWLGTTSGLFRFNGLTFQRVDLPRDQRLSTASIFTLFAPPSGGLWMGFQTGSIAFLREGQLTVYTEQDGLPAGTVKTIALDADGTIWAGTTTGIAKLEGGRWRRVGAEMGFEDTQAMTLFVDSAGTLWSVSRKQTLYRPRGEPMFRKGGRPLADSPEFGIAESPTGEVWLSGGSDLVKLAKNPNPGRRTGAAGYVLLFDRDGALWGREGSTRRLGDPRDLTDMLWSAAKSAATYSEKNTGSEGLNTMLEDREGNIWLSSNKGLTRISERNVREVPLPAAISGPYSIGLVAGSRGSLWVFDRNRDKQLKISRDGSVAIWSPGSISCAFRTDDEVVWFGGATGLWKSASDRIEPVSLPVDTGGFDVQAMARDRSGDLWVSIVRRGIYKWSGRQWSAYGGLEALARQPAVTLAADASGRVWFGYTEGRMAVVDGTRVRQFSAQDGPGVGNVTALYAKRSHVWVGGEFGLAFFDGTGFRTVVHDSGAAFNTVTGIVETADGDLWINGRDGVTHFPASETALIARDPAHRPHGETFGIFDGVEGNGVRLRPLPSLIEDTDGKIWFLTDRGLYGIDPQRIHRNPFPPPVVIESLDVGDQTFMPRGKIALSPGTTSLRIDYVGLSLTSAEKVHYRYRMDGVDADWRDAQGRRQALYTGLGPGRHRFHVIAANNDGVWNQTGATLEILIPPTFVQTGWFIALCAAGIGFMVWVTVKIRVRQVSARMRDRFAERLAERERIARELHDTLLQSTQGLILKFQAVANRIAPADATSVMLKDALDLADAELVEARNRILNLRESADPSGGLADALTAFGEELARAHSVTFRATVEGRQRRLQPVAKDEIYRIGREALLNAFRHARAATVEAQITYAATDFRLRIRDDGVGMDEDVARAGVPGHWGLRGMRERALRIGGQLDIRSRPGSGTELALQLDAKSAYAEH